MGQKVLYSSLRTAPLQFYLAASPCSEPTSLSLAGSSVSERIANFPRIRISIILDQGI